MRKPLLATLAFCLAAWTACGKPSDVGKELMPDASSWPTTGVIRAVNDSEGRRLVCEGGGAVLPVTINLQPDWGSLALSTAMRVTAVWPGKESWMTGRITMMFLDAAGNQVGGWPNVFGFTGTSGWEPCERIYAIPRGAATLQMGFGNLGTAGKVEFRPVSLRVCHIRGKKGNVLLPQPFGPDVWSLTNAWRQLTPPRERICLNGLWEFRPVYTNEAALTNAVPAPDDCWGWGKVPGLWPLPYEDGNSSPQIFRLSPSLADIADCPAAFDQAWYRRRLTVPSECAGKRLTLEATMLQTHADVFIDGRRAGELWFPGGELDLTAFLKPGTEQELALFVTARPINLSTVSFSAPDRVEKTKATVKCKGITGDLFLNATPVGGRIEAVQAITSTRKGTIAFVVETVGFATNAAYTLEAHVTGPDREAKAFQVSGLAPQPDGTLRLEAPWPGAKRWDVDAPSNRYEAVVSIRAAGGTVLDAYPLSFGFREFRIAGRDFLLNETPIHLRALYTDAMGGKADISSEGSCRELCRRVQKYGFNFLIAGNYNFSAGSVGYIDGLLNACDREGVLFAFSLPHIRVDFGGDLDKPEVAARYRAMTQWIIRRVRNHPSVVFYAMNHNLTGYCGDMNPLRIDGIYEPKCPPGVSDGFDRTRLQAEHAAAIAKSLDPTRPVYHHESGNLGDLHTVNCYLNWAPIQERSDWLEHWSQAGVKPLFFVEWGLPHISSWSSYRGPQFIWRCQAFQSLWAAEFAAAFRGDAAYEATPEAHRALRWEESLWARGVPFFWGELNRALGPLTNNYFGIQALYAADNWRSHRFYGASAMLPWDQGGLWRKLAPLASARCAADPARVKCPGIVPDNLVASDYLSGHGEADRFFAPTVLGETFLRWNQPDCAWIGGYPRATSKPHLYRPGERCRNSLVILNDRRHPQEVSYDLRLARGGRLVKQQHGTARVAAGGRTCLPIDWDIPDEPGDCELAADFAFADGIRQRDTALLRVTGPAMRGESLAPVALYDTNGLTAAHLKRLGIPFEKWNGAAAPSDGRVLAIGRGSLDAAAAGWLSQPQAGSRILVFEQTAGDLYGRLGFRCVEHGSRKLFPRFAQPVTRPLDAVDFSDWRGHSTLLPPHLEGIAWRETGYPKAVWCTFTNSAVWRCGNEGNVASVLIEKPARGDWRAWLDGEFDLQYAPLLERADGGARILFCQLDVTARSEPEPVADDLTVRMVRYLQQTEPPAGEPVRPLGPAAEQLCAALGVRTSATARIFVVSPGAKAPADWKEQLAAGAKVLGLGLSGADLRGWDPEPVPTTVTNACFTRIERMPPELNGLSNSDWAWHGAMTFEAFPATASNNQAVRVSRLGKGLALFWQVPPMAIDADKKPYLRTSKRRANAMASRLLANLGAAFVPAGPLYLDQPVKDDDPYRYYRW